MIPTILLLLVLGQTGDCMTGPVAYAEESYPAPHPVYPNELPERLWNLYGDGDAERVSHGQAIWFWSTLKLECRPLDWDGDGDVDLQDFAGLTAWLMLLADLNDDNVIDLRDVAVFQQVFGNPSSTEGPRVLGDIDGRNGVDAKDWYYFLLSWGQR